MSGHSDSEPSYSPLYSQDSYAGDGVTDYEPIAAPSGTTTTLFGVGARNSTWSTSRHEFHNVNLDHTGDGDEYGDENETNSVELGASDSESPEHLIFEPIDPPSGYTPLTFRPKILKCWVLLAIAVFYLAMLSLLGYLIYRFLFEIKWTIRNVNYYLAARYLPTVIGVCTTTLFSNTISTLRRILPFIHLADQKEVTNLYRIERSVCARYFPLSQRFEWIIMFLILANVTVHTTIAWKASLLKIEDTGRGVWLISIRLAPAALLGFTYLFAASTNVFIAIRYAGCSTGLKEDWDPTSLADIVLLFTPTDIVPNQDHKLDFRQWYRMIRTSGATYRLGYW